MTVFEIFCYIGAAALVGLAVGMQVGARFFRAGDDDDIIGPI